MYQTIHVAFMTGDIPVKCVNGNDVTCPAAFLRWMQNCSAPRHAHPLSDRCNWHDRRQQNNDFNICRLAVYLQCERRYHEQLQRHDLPNRGDGTRSPVPR